MSDLNKYLEMQRSNYCRWAERWSLENPNPVVGNYDMHNAWTDYDNYLFKGFDTNDLIALEYGCGPGRNLIQFKDRFQRIDGVDIAETNLEKAKINLQDNDIDNYQLFLCDGKSIPVKDEVYDVVFSVICLQHIACYDIRFKIFEDIYRVLKSGGYFCFQMGFGNKRGKHPIAEYYDNVFDASGTNGKYDVTIRNKNQLKDDLFKIGFTDFKCDLRPSPSKFENWIWSQCSKP